MRRRLRVGGRSCFQGIDAAIPAGEWVDRARDPYLCGLGSLPAFHGASRTDSHATELRGPLAFFDQPGKFWTRLGRLSARSAAPVGVHPARVLTRGTRPRRAFRSVRAPRADPSSRTARRRSFDVTPLTGRPVTLANGDCADLATGVTAYTRPSWRRIWTSPSREASSSTSARRCRAVEYVYSFIEPAPPVTSRASSHSSGSERPA
jgi:hypothetical protein